MSLRFSPVVSDAKRHLGFDLLGEKEIVCRAWGKTRLMKVPPKLPGVYEFKTSNKSIVTIDSVPNPPADEWHVEITGHAPGTASVTAVRDGRVEDTVKVFVYPSRTVKVNFFCCHDSRAGESPQFTLADVPDLVARMNALFKYQANIIFETHVLRNVTLDSSIDLRTSGQSTDKLTKIMQELRKFRDKYDKSASHKNVFLVRKWGAKDRPGETEAVKRDVFGTTDGNCCIIEDMPTKDFTVILTGHELAHTLGAQHANIAYPEALMAEKIGDTHLHIYPKQVKEMRGGEP